MENILLERHLERVRNINMKSDLGKEWRMREHVIWRGRKLHVVNKEEESWDFSSSWQLGLTPCVISEMSLSFFFSAVMTRMLIPRRRTKNF